MITIVNYKVTPSSHGTVVEVKVAGQFFAKIACSRCGIISENFPSFRDTRCVLCATHGATFVKEAEDYLCEDCIVSFEEWTGNNPDALKSDFLIERLGRDYV